MVNNITSAASAINKIAVKWTVHKTHSRKDKDEK